MVIERSEYEPVSANEHDADLIVALDRYLQAQTQRSARLVGADGQAVDIPASVYEVLRQLAPLLARGATVQLVPLHEEMTTQQAADLLNVSRPFLVKLLDEGKILYHRADGAGTHRRVRSSDVTAYKRQRSAARRRALAELTALSADLGEYD